MKRIITLTTDFGTRDYYVPSLIGQIRLIAPDSEIYSLTHEVSHQNIIEAAFILKNQFQNFPKGTIHVIVVDPEVGSDRDAVLVRHDDYFFIAPDNGILTLALETTTPESAFSISDSLYKNKFVSPVFHGRDVFTPIAAHLANGVSPTLLGIKKNELVDLRWSLPSYDKNRIIGQVIHIDHFGNLISNIHEKFLFEWAGNEPFGVSLTGWEPIPLSLTYSDAEPGDPVVVIGSSHQLEIAVYQSAANQMLDAKLGTQIIVEKAKV